MLPFYSSRQGLVFNIEDKVDDILEDHFSLNYDGINVEHVVRLFLGSDFVDADGGFFYHKP